MLPTSAMMRTTVKTKNIASAPRGRPVIGWGVGSYVSGSVTHDSGRILMDVCGPDAAAIAGRAGCLFRLLRAVNMRDETACLSMANVDVLDPGLLENSGDCRLGRSVIHFFASGYPSIATVTFEHEW